VISARFPNSKNLFSDATNKKLTFDREMQGTAEIITKDLRIIELVFNQFRSLLDNAGERFG